MNKDLAKEIMRVAYLQDVVEIPEEVKRNTLFLDSLVTVNGKKYQVMAFVLTQGQSYYHHPKGALRMFRARNRLHVSSIIYSKYILETKDFSNENLNSNIYVYFFRGEYNG